MNGSTEKAMPMYVGQSKVVIVNDSKEKTPAGKPIMEIVLDDNRRLLIPEKMLASNVSKSPISDSELRDNRVMEISKAVIEILAEHDIQLQEMEHLVGVLKMTYDENYERAQKVLWGTDKKTWLDMWRVLKNAGVKSVDN